MLNFIKRMHWQHASAGMPPRIRLRTAYHEAGHAYFMSLSPLWKNINIRLNSTGGLAHSEYGDRASFSDAEAGWLILRMIVGGAVAEQYFFNSYSKYGTWQDISRGIDLVASREAMLLEYVDFELLPYRLDVVDRMLPTSASAHTRKIMATAVCSALELVGRDQDNIRRLGKTLYKKSFVPEREIRKILK
jgi:ATP-dependent Zn protease